MHEWCSFGCACIDLVYLLPHNKLPPNSVASDNNNFYMFMSLWFRDLGRLWLGDSYAPDGVDWGYLVLYGAGRGVVVWPRGSTNMPGALVMAGR